MTSKATWPLDGHRVFFAAAMLGRLRTHLPLDVLKLIYGFVRQSRPVRRCELCRRIVLSEEYCTLAAPRSPVTWEVRDGRLFCNEVECLPSLFEHGPSHALPPSPEFTWNVTTLGDAPCPHFRRGRMLYDNGGYMLRQVLGYRVLGDRCVCAGCQLVCAHRERRARWKAAFWGARWRHLFVF